MCGPGYWFWLIPLASGAHSLGIVCDAAMHPLQTINTHERAMQWLRTHQPAVARALDARGAALQDFAFLRHYSHGCRQVFSGDGRWAMTGEAGVFLDPFYSPGTDFIAIANTYIVDLIGRDRAGRAFAPYAPMYEQLYQSFYENTLTLYEGQYPLFGDAQVLPVKVIWDYTFYWSLLSPLFFAGRLTDLAMLGRLRDAFTAGRELNLAMQRLLRAWGERNDGATQPDGRLLDQFKLDWFLEMNRALNDTLDDAAFEARIRANVEIMRRLAAEALDRARRVHPGLDDEGLAALTAGVSITPALLPAVWYALEDDADAAARAAA
jgi:hypothetical protein